MKIGKITHRKSQGDTKIKRKETTELQLTKKYTNSQ